MSAIQVVEIDATSPEFSAATVLFDQYRSFYGKPTDLSLAQHYLRERLEAGESTVLTPGCWTDGSAFASCIRVSVPSPAHALSSSTTCTLTTLTAARAWDVH